MSTAALQRDGHPALRTDPTPLLPVRAADTEVFAGIGAVASEEDLRSLRAVAGTVQQDVPLLARRIRAAIRARYPRCEAQTNGAPLGEIETYIGAGLRLLSTPSWAAVEAVRDLSTLGDFAARAGIRLDVLLTCHRIGCTTVWAALVEAAERHGTAAVHALLGTSSAWWQLHDQQSSAIAGTYRQLTSRLTAVRDEQSGALLDALLDGRIATGAVQTAGAVLDLPVHGAYAVAVVELAGPRAEAPRMRAVEDIEVRRVLWRRQATRAIAVIALGDGVPAERLGRLFVPTNESRIGLSPLVDGLAKVHKARELAALAARTCFADGDIAVLDDNLPAALVAANPELAGRMVQRVIGPVLALPRSQRDLLLDTLRVWLEAGGAADIAGRRLFCHRNTVLNRLRRIEQLCGKDLGSPMGLVLTALALHAYHLDENAAIGESGAD